MFKSYLEFHFALDLANHVCRPACRLNMFKTHCRANVQKFVNKCHALYDYLKSFEIE